MNLQEREEFAVMKNEITHIKTDVEEIKVLLKDHIRWESKKYDDLKNEFASKWVERAIIAVMTTVVGGIILAVVTLI
jgi:adenine/guanine phosphoribosyltransferase-like PRPP-binding protein